MFQVKRFNLHGSQLTVKQRRLGPRDQEFSPQEERDGERSLGTMRVWRQPRKEKRTVRESPQQRLVNTLNDPDPGG